MTEQNSGQAPNPQVTLLEQKINSVHEALVVTGQSDIARMSERVFVGIWLPFFAGDTHPTYEVTLQHWTNFAGNGYQSVHVVDPAGTVLFTVPPVFNRSAINPINNSGQQSVAHVIKSAEQYSQVHPVQGSAYLDNELSKRAMIMKVPPNVLGDLDTWNAIFTRYGRKPLVDVAPAEQASAVAPDPGLDYDVDPL